MHNHRLILLIAVLITPLLVFPQKKMQHFKKQLPPGNYSGICPIGNDLFAVVDDKAEEDGFYVFRLVVDANSGKITEAENMGYRSAHLPNRDMEGICFRESTNTLFISGEQDNEVYEYNMDGTRTGRKLDMPDYMSKAHANAGLEALCYDSASHLFFTMTEQPLPGEDDIRLLAFSDELSLVNEYRYVPDTTDGKQQCYGVSALCALNDGRLLVLERQIHIPRLKIGAKARTRIYAVKPDSTQTTLEKHLVTEFTTRMTLTGRKFANFEGMCQPCSGWLLLMADSQNRYKGVLRDWLKTIQL